jgi:hypothetical protein
MGCIELYQVRLQNTMMPEPNLTVLYTNEIKLEYRQIFFIYSGKNIHPLFHVKLQSLVELHQVFHFPYFWIMFSIFIFLLGR